MQLIRCSYVVALMIGILLTGRGTVMAAEPSGAGYFFRKKPYIHPKIVEDLSTWISDGGEQVVAINLPGSMGTNRYFGAIKTKTVKGASLVYYEQTDQCEKGACISGPPHFGYRLAGTTSSGVRVLVTESSGGGSGTFMSLLFVTVQRDKGLSYDEMHRALHLNRQRWIVRRLAEIPLGDRYDGEITVRAHSVVIGKDRNPWSAGVFKKGAVLKID
jgi:hypothetical protein